MSMLKRPWTLVAVLVLLALLATAGLWLGRSEPARMLLAGSADVLPRATAESESILPEALEAARVAAARRGTHALLVHRRGHRVFEYFRAGHESAAGMGGGELAAAVLSLALHEPGQAEGADPATAAALVSERLWLPLRAGDAWLVDDGTQGPRQCCIEAQLDDWMRVGDLLLGVGTYLGERFVSADAVRALLAGRTAAPWQGEEPLLARDGLWFDLQPGVRLWLAPRRALAMLVWADADVARDTLIPNIILRGLNDQAPAIGGDISDLVPGH
jgi:hypothetical protein